MFYTAFSRPVGVLLAILFFSSEALALEEPSLLPAGISRFRVVGVVTNRVTHQYNEDGVRTPNAVWRVNAKQMAAAQPQLKGAVDTLNNIRPGLGDNLIFYDVDTGVSVRNQSYVAAYERGISDRMNIGIRVYSMRDQASRYSMPKLVRRGDTAGRIKQVSPGAAPMLDIIVEGFRATPEKQLAQGFDTGLRQDLSSKGYQYPTNFSRFRLSYTEVGGKYLIHKGEKSVTSAMLGVRIPTGQENDITNPFDRDIVGDTWGLGLEMYQSYKLFSFLDLRAAAKGKYLFRKTKQRAVPFVADKEGIPSVMAGSDQIKDTTQGSGTRFDGEVAAVVDVIGSTVTAWGAYQYNHTGELNYSGPDADVFYYEGLKQLSSHSTAAEFGLAYSTIPAFRAKQFGMPLSVEATYNTMLSGVNVPERSYLRMDLKLYF